MAEQEVTALALKPGGAGDLDAALAFLAVLAFPEKHRTRGYARRDDFVSGAQAYFAKHGIKRYGWPKKRISDELRRYPEERIWTPITAAARIIVEHRLRAADAALGMVVEQGWRTPELQIEITHGGITLDGVNAASRALGKLPSDVTNRRDTSWRDTNWIARTWAPSKPVLHMALALHTALLERGYPHKLNLLWLIDDPAWSRRALVQAEQWRTMILPLMPALAYDPALAVVLREK
jgi:hypothetical protein